MFGLFSKKAQKLEVSRYNTLVRCEEGWLLHGQMKGALILLDEEKYEQYVRFSNGDHKNISKKFIKILNDLGYLKPLGFDERETIGEFWDKNVNSANAKALTIVTTDRCNLGCTYCYEAKSDWRLMTDEVQEQLEKFIDVYLNSTPTKTLGITWFGGEPTLNMKCIERITKYVDDLCNKLKISWVPYIITNGTTLKQNVVKRLIDCKIKGLQITIDGIKEDHDLKRPYLAQMKIEDMNEFQVEQRKKIDSSFGSLPILGQAPAPVISKSSFDDIIENVGNCYDAGLVVSLRINVDKINKNKVEDLYKMIYDRGWMEKNEKGGVVRVYTNPIFDGCSGRSNTQMTKKEHTELELSLDKWSQEKSSEAYRKALKFSGDTCTANKHYQFVINPSGAIIKCWHHSTDDSHAIGHITDLEIAKNGSKSRDKYQFNPIEDAECYDCSVLPICMGGCKANNQFVEKGYSGNHDMGCISARYALPQQIVQLYNMSKNDEN